MEKSSGRLLKVDGGLLFDGSGLSLGSNHVGQFPMAFSENGGLEAEGIHTPEAINRQASVWMKRGIALLEANTAVSLPEAVAHFDRAIELRRRLPLDADPVYRYGLAAGWMNRGDVFTRLGSKADLAKAVQSYDEALILLNDLPLDANPLFRRRLAIAWQNRGLTLQAQNTPPALLEAARSFETALRTLQADIGGTILDRDFLLAAVWLNKANLLATEKTTAAAQQAYLAAQEVLARVAGAEEKNVTEAELGLKARHILCQAIASLLMQTDLGEPVRISLIGEGTDLVEAGIGLARRWEQQGFRQFRTLAQELFRFGARVYQTYQPHFLSEFLLENLDPAHSSTAFATDSTMHAVAWESLWQGFREIQRGGFKVLNTPQFEGLLEKLRTLRVAEERLAQLRQQYLAER
jgi:tetratricopeptide (TPR) repeat protein